VITNKNNGNQYVGASINVEQRIKQHRLAKGETELYNIIRKDGWRIFSWRILQECSQVDLSSCEVLWIEKLIPYYNIRALKNSWRNPQVAIR